MTTEVEELLRSGTDAALAGDLPAAASALRRCLAMAQPGSEIRATAAQNLAFTLVEIYNKGRTDAAGTRELVGEMRQLSDEIPEPNRPSLHFQIGKILEDAFDRWEMTADLVAAYEAARRSVDCAEPNWPLAGDAHSLAARLLVRLDGAGGIRRVADRQNAASNAVHHAEQALRIGTLPPFAPPPEPRVLLGAALRLRGLLRQNLDDARAALDLLEAARRQVESSGTADAQWRARLANDIGLCWKDLRDADPQALDREVAEFEAAQAQDEEGNDDWLAIRRRNLANALVARARRTSRGEDRLRSYVLYREVMELPRISAQQVELTSWNWLESASLVGDWDEAATAGEAGLDRLIPHALSQAGPAAPDPVAGVTFANAVLWAVGRLGRRTAQLRVRAGDALGAVHALERSRALLVPSGSRLFTERGELPVDAQATRRMLDATTEKRTLCYLLDTGEQEGAAILAPPGESLRVIPLRFPDSLTDTSARYQSAAQSLPRTLDYVGFEELLREIATTVWGFGFGEAVEATQAGSELAVVGTGRLSFLPLHVASPDPGGIDALDRVVLTFQLSARHLFTADSAEAVGQGGDLLLLDHPGTGTAELGAVDNECAAVEEAWRSLTSGRALRFSTLADAVRELPHAGVVHAACHAHADLLEPYTSALYLRDGSLSVTRLTGLGARARLAFLSACSTGVSGADLPDEGIALASVLQQAGVAGVVSSMWPVPDEAAAAVAIHFYEQLLDGQPSPAHALRASERQLWRGEVVTGELSARYLGDRVERVRAMRGWLACWNAFRFAGV